MQLFKVHTREAIWTDTTKSRISPIKEPLELNLEKKPQYSLEGDGSSGNRSKLCFSCSSTMCLICASYQGLQRWQSCWNSVYQAPRGSRHSKRRWSIFHHLKKYSLPVWEKTTWKSEKNWFPLRDSVPFLVHVHASRGDCERWNPAIRFILKEG